MRLSNPTLFVVDDDEAMLDALATMAKTVDLPVETFLSAQQFLASYEPQQPGCLVLDVRIPDMSGLELQEVMNARGIDLPVIVISGHAEVPMAVRAVKAGAVDFLEKPFKTQDLLDRIYTAFARDSEQRQQQRRLARCAERLATLTPRERDVMELLVVGHAGKEIASLLDISYKTMEKYRAKVMHKTQADSVAELVLMAVGLGLISADGQPPGE